MQNNLNNPSGIDLSRARPLPLASDDNMITYCLTYVSLLWVARRFIFKAMAIGGILCVILAMALPKEYESTTQLMPPSKDNSTSASLLADMVGGGALNTIGSEALGLQSPGAVYEKVLESRTVQDRLVSRFNLRNVYHVSLYADARRRLAEKTEIDNDRKSGVITLTVVANSPQLAAALAAGYVEELNSLMVSLDNSIAHRRRVFLESRLKGVNADIERYSTQLGQFSSKNTTINLNEQGRAMVTAEESLHGQAIAAESELAGLRQIYSPENAHVRSAEAKLQELQQELAKMRGDSTGVDQDSGDVDDYPSIRKLPLLGVKYADLYRNLAVQESVFEILTKQYELAKVDEAKDLPTVRVLDEANIPEKKYRPLRTLIVLMGTFLSMIFASTYVIALNWWNSQDPNSALTRLVSQLRVGMAEDIAAVPLLGRKRSKSRHYAEESRPGENN